MSNLLELKNQDSFPEIKTSKGILLRAGTVALFLENITLYNQGDRTEKLIEKLSDVETLVKSGLFDLFLPEEWITGSNKGRTFVGNKAKEYLKNK